MTGNGPNGRRFDGALGAGRTREHPRLVARYNANGDSDRFDPMLELFAEGATMELPTASSGGAHDGVHVGQAAIRAMFEGVVTNTGSCPEAGARFIRHFTATHQIDVLSESEAKGRCYYVVLTDRGIDHWVATSTTIVGSTTAGREGNAQRGIGSPAEALCLGAGPPSGLSRRMRRCRWPDAGTDVARERPCDRATAAHAGGV